MPTLLRIDSSPLGSDASFSRQLTTEFVQQSVDEVIKTLFEAVVLVVIAKTWHGAFAGSAAYFAVSRTQHVQLNVENLFDNRYYTNADSNTNISPGSPRAIRVALTTRF